MKHRGKKGSKKRSRFLTLFFLAVLACCAWYIYKSERAHGFNLSIAENRPVRYAHFGIDVSHHQGRVDWDSLFRYPNYDTLISFVYYKVTEGEFHVDREWSYNQKQLRQSGRPSGAYHFFLPKKDPYKQAANFLKHYTYKKGDCRPVLDVETDTPSLSELLGGMKIWLDEVEKKTGVRPIIYTSHHFYQEKFKNHFTDYDFWVAAYSRMPDLENDQRIGIWQYSEEGLLPTLDEGVDLNVADAIPL